MVMPRFFADIHDNILLQSYENPRSRVQGVYRVVMGQNKDGYMLPLHLVIRLIPTLEVGIKFIGFLREVAEQRSESNAEADDGLTDQEYYIAYNKLDKTIVGVTRNVSENFGIPLFLVNQNSLSAKDFTIDSIFESIDEE